MKSYLIFIFDEAGRELGSRIIKAAGHNAAEKKAVKLYPAPLKITVEYTEV